MKKTNLTTLPNSNFRARRRFGPSSRAKRAFVLGSSLRKIPQITIWSCCLAFLATLDVSALSYSDNVGVNFTFDQSLTVSLSSADIVINNLAPGSSSDSNIIDINVLSNNLSGYTLTSTVGNGNNYNDTNLTHTNNSSNTFTGLSTSDSISSLDDFDNNTWGYAYSTDSNTWSNYSGLPKYNDTTDVATLRTSTGPSSETGDDTYFKIAAKASTSQPSGEYRNVINFTVTAEHNPVSFYDAFSGAGKSMHNGYYKMQDMTADICSNIYTSQLDDNTDTMEAQLIDIRDNNIYWVAKLKDGHCWMTQGLGLDLQHDNILTHETSDIGWTENDPNRTWNPDVSANTIEFKGAGGTAVDGWGSSVDLPYSARSYGATINDDVYIVSSGTTSDDVVYASLQTCMSDSRISGSSVIAGTGEDGHLSGVECSHYKVGNYYNFAAANASSSISNTVGHKVADTDNYTMMPDSVCPAGWRMPHGLLAEPVEGASSPNNSEFDTLLYVYGVTDSTGVNQGQIAGYAPGGLERIRVRPLYFARSGHINVAVLFYEGRNGNSWANTIGGTSVGYRLLFQTTNNNIQPAGSYTRTAGYPVRCLAR